MKKYLYIASFLLGSVFFASMAYAYTQTLDLGVVYNWTAAMGYGTSTPWAMLSVSTSTASAPTTPLFAIGSSSNATLFAINGAGQVALTATQPATSTTITLDWSATGQQLEYQIGTAAVTITLINATTTQYWGSTKRVWICNPPLLSAGALTWAGVEWIGTAPAQTTTAAQCDMYSFDVTRATSTSAYKVVGGANVGLQ